MICPNCGADSESDCCGGCGYKIQDITIPQPKSLIVILTEFLKKQWFLVLVCVFILLTAKGLSESFWDYITTVGFLSAITAIIGTLIAGVRRKPHWKKWLAGIGIACMVFLVGAVNTPEVPEEQDTASQPPAQTGITASPQTAQSEPLSTSQALPPNAAALQPQVYGLGLTPNEFKNRFNSASDMYGKKYSIDKIDVNEFMIFTHYFSEGVKMLVIVDKNSQNIVEISLTQATNATVSEKADYTLIIGNIVQSLIPEISGTKRGDFLKELIPVGEKNFNNTITKNGIKFRTAAVDGYLNFWVYME